MSVRHRASRVTIRCQSDLRGRVFPDSVPADGSRDGVPTGGGCESVPSVVGAVDRGPPVSLARATADREAAALMIAAAACGSCESSAGAEPCGTAPSPGDAAGGRTAEETMSTASVPSAACRSEASVRVDSASSGLWWGVAAVCGASTSGAFDSTAIDTSGPVRGWTVTEVLPCTRRRGR